MCRFMLFSVVVERREGGEEIEMRGVERKSDDGDMADKMYEVMSCE